MSSNIVFIMGFNYDSNCYLINGNTLVDTGAGQNKDYLFSKLRENGILVRHFTKDRIKDYNRITIGSLKQMQTLVATIKNILENSL